MDDFDAGLAELPQERLLDSDLVIDVKFGGLPAAMLLAACGGGGGSTSTAPPTSSPTPTPTPTPTPPPAPPVAAKPTRPEAARFLSQATMGFGRAEVDRVAAIDYAAWIDEQFATPRDTTHWDWLVANGYNVTANQNNETGFDPVMWRQLIAGPDQLRQRVGMALLDFLVVGIGGVPTSWKQFATAAYVDVLMDNAFGNFRTMLGQISTNPAMAYFLTFAGNRKANAAAGSVPDENYAREVMQLFTLGPVKLNADGSVQMNGAVALETYTQDDISGLARVFTGWNLDSSDNTIPDRFRRPMVNTASQHESGVKTFLGTTIAAGTDGPTSLNQAMDTLFAHPNIAPFVSKRLIQGLVTSNPPAGYVARVAQVFANNGAGVRGDMKAVVKAILLDTEARTAAVAATTTAGKLREPINRLVGWARAFGVTSPSSAWAIGDTSSSVNRLSQSPGRSTSVFNFFRPGYTPAGSAIANQGLVAPEFQLANEPSVIAYVNYMSTLVQNGTGDVKADYTAMLALAADSQGLVDEVDILLGAQLSAATKASVRGAVDAISATATNGPQNRVYTAALLTLAAPEYLIQK